MIATRIRHIIEETDTRAGRIFDLSIQALIVLSLVAFSVETLPDLSPEAKRALGYFEVFTITVFTVEYLLRVYVAKRKLRFIFSFYGLVDLLAILPFYISRGIDLRSIRALRFFRLFRLFKLARYSKAMRRYRLALQEIKAELLLFLTACLFVVYLGSVGIYYFEHQAQPEVFASIFDSMWWAVATLTTVGYGDVYPITAGGRLFTSLILLVGLGIVAVPAGLVASSLSKVLEEEEDD